MKSDIFILLFGHGRSGTSATWGFLNLSPDINMAFEENMMILQDTNRKVWAEGESFSYDHHLAKRVLPEVYNGNKIIFGSHFISAERIVECVERKIVITNNVFTDLKILFLKRDKKDTINSIADRRKVSVDWATENWEKNEVELTKLRSFYADSLTFDFYDFIKNFNVRKEVFQYLGLRFDSKWNSKEVDTLAYGKRPLSIEELRFFSREEKKPVIKSPTKTKRVIEKKPRRKKSRLGNKKEFKVGFEKIR